MKGTHRTLLTTLIAVVLLYASPSLLRAGAMEEKGSDALQKAKQPLLLDSGPVTGEEKDGLFIYRGIPYAAPPVGELRWKPPQKVKHWEEVRPCVAFGSRAIQPKSILSGDFGLPMSEDCLYLNVWTPFPSPRRKMPVMVWIHGGGFTTGTGSSHIYDGSALARQGVVLVTINYRLGPLGFFGHPLLSAESAHHVSGNYGLLDQIEALRWVRRNIVAFGGNPGCVTIFGESAGGSSVTALMASPMAKGLFHRAIAESGFAAGLPSLKRARRAMRSVEEEGSRLAKQLGCDREKDPLAALRAMDASKILEASHAAQGLFGKGVKYRPAIDGWVLPDNPVTLFNQGRVAAVPFMTGTNADEGTMFTVGLPVRTIREFTLMVRRLFGEHAPQVLELYPVRRDEEVKQALTALVGDSAFIAPARFAAKSMASLKGRAYLYHFTRIPPALAGRRLGSFHSLEIPYVFESAGTGMMRDPIDRQLSRAMSSRWVAFARTGDPAILGSAAWPSYDGSADCYLEFGDRLSIKKGLHKRACDIFEQIMLDGKGR